MKGEHVLIEISVLVLVYCYAFVCGNMKNPLRRRGGNFYLGTRET